ncbi:MAG: hypothetical protein ACRC46_03885 [Thermoguttaceae bacterium]
MTPLITLALFAQQGQGGGNGVGELIKALVVLSFLFGPALLQWIFGAKTKKDAKTPQPVKVAKAEAAPRSAMTQEIDDFVRARDAQNRDMQSRDAQAQSTTSSSHAGARSSLERESDNLTRVRDAQNREPHDTIDGNRRPRREKASRPQRSSRPAPEIVAAVPAQTTPVIPLAEQFESTSFASPLAANRIQTQGVEHHVAFGHHPVALMLHSPSSLANAVVLSEVLRRPTW